MPKNPIKPEVLVLLALLVPGPGFAQPLDIPDDEAMFDEGSPDGAAPAPALEDLEGDVQSKGPMLVEPKFDIIDEPLDAGGASNLNQTDPKPAPGLTIKIPTD